MYNLYLRASNVHESVSDAIVIIVEESEGEPVEICEDSPEFANCDLIVKSGFCEKSPIYAKFCCKSCADAASGGDNSEAEENEDEEEGDNESEGK